MSTESTTTRTWNPKGDRRTATMSSPQDEFEDSRTSGVGRKRDLEDLIPRQDARSVTSDEEDNERSSKRAKQAHEPLGDSAAHDEEALDMPSSFGPPSSQPQDSNPPNIAQSSLWNKKVQTGLRTSFGSKVNIKQQIPTQRAFLLRDDSPEISEPSNQAEVVNADDDGDVNMEPQNDGQDILRSITKQDADYDDGDNVQAILQEYRPVFGEDFQDTADGDSDSGVDYEPGRSSQPQSPANGLVEDIEEPSRSFPGMTSDVGHGKMALTETSATTHTESASQRRPSLEERLPSIEKEVDWSMLKEEADGRLWKAEVDRSEPVFPQDLTKLSQAKQAKQPKREYRIPGATYQLSQMSRGGEPLSLQELTFQDFRSHFISSNSKTKDLQPRHFKGAFSTYIAMYYPNAPAEIRAKALTTVSAKEKKQKANSKIENPATQKIIDKSKTSKKKGDGKIEDLKIENVRKIIQETRPLPAESRKTAIPATFAPQLPQPIHQPPALVPASALYGNASYDHPQPAQQSAMPVIPSLPDVEHQAVQIPSSSVDARDDMGDQEDVVMEEDESLDLQDAASADREPADAMDVEITKMELEIQQKYFPAVAGSSTGPRCLACADTGHKTINCPALSCTVCGVSGNHSTFTCPQNERCGKCRRKGHAIAECPEKLFANNTEVDNCELCGSPGHLEMACHTIWRTFAPRPEEIKRVREIPIHCYCCGGSGHYGPECGIHKGKTLSGGFTWSQANLQIYLDPNSSERAISAGKDYSITQRKVFTIKGKANDPITLDDSDEDASSFIRPKINNNPSTRRNGSIRFEQSSRITQQPSDNDYSRSRNPPRQAAPIFGSNTRYQNDSARYGRERSFSPPPIYDRFASEIDHYQPQLPYRQNSYGPVPTNPRPSQEYPPQPVRMQSGGGNGSGGRGHRPKRGGGQAPSRAPPGPPHKKAKKPKKSKPARGGKAG